MPWWSWVLLWTVLGLGLCGMLAGFGITLFRKLMKAADALAELGDQVAGLDFGADEPAAGGTATRPTPAVFQDPFALLAEVERLRAERTHRRQLRHDSLIVRGKLLRNAPLI